ncbi:MAG: helix-turn-helix transcriptional regulator [Bacteroidales bacterium]|nr:helix-turn-helix transcriptional regulator [Bacteroidales bacterium]
MENYGDYIRALRESKKLTLRDVEKKIDVSNAYLSQLESGKIKQPSPITLYKLAELYGVEYEVLMKKVGYPVPRNKQTHNKSSKDILINRFGDISNDEEIELLEYLKFIRTRRK